jgi:multimeric flavodoxin WrbA
VQATVLSCTLKPSPEESNTEALATVVTAELEAAGVDCETIRLADRNLPPGVETDMGDGDDWPAIHDRILASEILIFATPTWVGRPSSLAQRALERLDALISETDDDDRPVAFGKVAGVVVTGNEDGAHHVISEISGALVDIGYTIPAQAWTYWNKGPGPGDEYLESDEKEWSHETGRTMARHLAGVAGALKPEVFPPHS